MFDHLGIVVKDLAVARAFYEPVLATIGIRLLQNNVFPGGDGWMVFTGDAPFPFFVVASGNPSYWAEHHRPSQSPIHLSFRAPSKEAVDAFHATCLAQGGSDNGAPGDRMGGADGGSYYAAYIIDLDGNNIEAGVRY